MKITYCLDCEQTIELNKKTHIGSIVECPSCESAFQVVKTEPIELDWTYETSYSWEQLLEEEEEINNETDLWSWEPATNRRVNDYGHRNERRRSWKGDHRNTYEHAF